MPTISSAVQRRPRRRRRRRRRGEGPLDAGLLDRMQRYWQRRELPDRRPDLPAGQSAAARAAAPEHIKPRLLGHWGTSPGLSFIYVHLNRLITRARRRRDLPRRAGPRRAGAGRQCLPRRHLLRDLSRTSRRTPPGCAGSSASSRRPAACRATSACRRPARSTKAASSATCSPTPSAPPSTTRT